MEQKMHLSLKEIRTLVLQFFETNIFYFPEI